MKIITTLILSIFLFSCSESENITPEMTVKLSDKNFGIVAQGELEALQATQINAPSKSRRPQTIAWVVDQYSKVNKGDIIVKFDGTTFQNEVDEAEYELMKLNYDRLQKIRELDNSLDDFNNEGKVVEFEYEMAQKFNINDPLLYTKIEMIEASDNEEYLEAKSQYIENMAGHFKGKSDSEIQLIESKSQKQNFKLSTNEANLSQLEILAPHDGIVVLKKDWDGSFPQAGKSIFPGRGIASLPDLSEMNAKIYVPEIEAIGLKNDQNVDIKLHAFPNIQFTGTISAISKTAQPKQRGNPVKYFTVTVKINEKDETKLLPGQRLNATMVTSDNTDALIIPIQTIFREKNKSWVYKKNNKGSFVKNDVSTGICSSSQCIIKSGLQENDIIALTEPNKTSETKI
ncbi:MAG: efflux RND transporter periplasmic adaptor subunit [Marinicellaceae bacterium]